MAHVFRKSPSLGAGASPPEELTFELTVAPTTTDGAEVELSAAIRTVVGTVINPDDRFRFRNNDRSSSSERGLSIAESRDPVVLVPGPELFTYIVRYPQFNVVFIDRLFAHASGVIFMYGFESGNTSSWSSETP